MSVIFASPCRKVPSEEWLLGMKACFGASKAVISVPPEFKNEEIPGAVVIYSKPIDGALGGPDKVKASQNEIYSPLCVKACAESQSGDVVIFCHDNMAPDQDVAQGLLAALPGHAFASVAPIKIEMPPLPGIPPAPPILEYSSRMSAWDRDAMLSFMCKKFGESFDTKNRTVLQIMMDRMNASGVSFIWTNIRPSYNQP